MNPRPDYAMIRDYTKLWLDHVRITAERTGLSNPGWIYVFGHHSVMDYDRKHNWFSVHQVEDMAQCVIDLAERGYKVLMPASTVQYGSMGKKEDLVWVYGLVADYDGYGNAPFDPSYAVQTSLRDGELHAHLYYMTSMSPERGNELGPRFRDYFAMDSKTGSTTQKWRFPGTLNHKQPCETAMLMANSWSNRAYTFERLNQLLPAARNVSPAPSSCPSGASIEDLDAQFRAHGRKGPNRLTEPTGAFYPKLDGTGDRSKQFWDGVRHGFRAGISIADMTRLVLAKYRDGCARKYFDEHRSVAEGEAAIERIIKGAAENIPLNTSPPRLDFNSFTVNGVEVVGPRDRGIVRAGCRSFRR